MSSGDVFQLLLLHSFFTARTKFFFQGFFEPSTTRFYICQFNGMGSADTDIKVIDLRDLLYDLMTPFFTWLTKSMTARFCGYIPTTSAKSTTSNWIKCLHKFSRHQELRSSSPRAARSVGVLEFRPHVHTEVFPLGTTGHVSYDHRYLCTYNRILFHQPPLLSFLLCPHLP